MSRPAPPIKLNPNQTVLIQTLARCREVAHSLVQRAKIILSLSQGNSNKSVAEELGLSDETVSVWRKRWVEGSTVLEDVDKKELSLRENVIALLADKPRSGRPDLSLIHI